MLHIVDQTQHRGTMLVSPTTIHGISYVSLAAAKGLRARHFGCDAAEFESAHWYGLEISRA